MNEKSQTPVVSCAYRCGVVNWKEHKPMMYQKLVRDNIPAIIEKSSETCVTRKLSDKEYEDALTNKLQEEVKELLEAYTAKERSVLDCAEEMADVMVYCQNLLDKLGLDADEIINMKMAQNEAKYPVEKAKGSAAKYNQL